MSLSGGVHVPRELLGWCQDASASGDCGLRVQRPRARRRVADGSGARQRSVGFGQPLVSRHVIAHRVHLGLQGQHLLGIAEKQAARFFQDISGKVIEIRRDKLEEITQQRHEYNLINADAVRRIGDNQAILVSANKNPAILATQAYFQDGRLRKIPQRFRAEHGSGTGG